MIHPPAMGPTVGASTARTPAKVVAMPWRRSGKSRKTAANTAGMSVPPEKPWTIRQAIKRVEAAARRTTDRGKRKGEDGAHEEPPHAQDAHEKAGQRDRDHFGDQIGGLNPAHRFGSDADRVLDRGERRRHDLDVQDRHEHADAHRAEADRGCGRTRARPCACQAPAPPRDSTSAAFSARMRIARTQAFAALKASAYHGRPRQSGNTAISPTTTR